MQTIYVVTDNMNNILGAISADGYIEPALTKSLNSHFWGADGTQVTSLTKSDDMISGDYQYIVELDNGDTEEVYLTPTAFFQ